MIRPVTVIKIIKHNFQMCSELENFFILSMCSVPITLWNLIFLSIVTRTRKRRVRRPHIEKEKEKEEPSMFKMNPEIGQSSKIERFNLKVLKYDLYLVEILRYFLPNNLKENH